MRKRRYWKALASGLLVLALSVPVAAQPANAASIPERAVRVGLAYGGGALINGNLQNSSGYGAGYRLGYFDEALDFVELARTEEEETEITVLKTQNTWVVKSGSGYAYANADNGGKSIGCYHVQIPGTYVTFEDAAAAAEQFGGFVAWVDGSYYVRVGAYLNKEGAEGELARLGEGEIVGTSSYAVVVTRTGTTDILFQFDGGAKRALGVMPDVTGAEAVHTWCKGYRYQGGFRYERLNGGDLTVVNIVGMEDYIKGVIPYEMSNSWPVEALKVQAVCARSYGYNKIRGSGHRDDGFDICTKDHCQVYHGVGTSSPTYQANEVTDRAVEETAGKYAWYGSSVIEAVYASSHGGASEGANYIWGTNLNHYPYLCGVVDPYEIGAADKNKYSSWTVRYTAADLTKQLQSFGFGVGTTLDRVELTYSKLGNVIQAKLCYANGQSNTITARTNNRANIKAVFGLRSLHFTVNGQTLKPGEGGNAKPGPENGYTVNGSGGLSSLEGLYTISGSGTITQTGKDLYTISGKGDVSELAPVSEPEERPDGSNEGGGTVVVSGRNYVFNGSGWGHQIGLSQYGARAMVDQGFTYDEIIEFYFPGTQVE